MSERPLYTLGLIEACEGIRSGRFGARTYTDALLERVSSQDGEILAFARLDPAEARAAADRCDAVRGLADDAPPLLGIPVGVKDIFATAGIPTEMGSPAFAGHIPEQSAALVLQLERQGGFVFGKTVTTECAFLFPGKTRNPWNPLHTPGGSSSGSAAAVAAGFLPAAIGTQTNGSVIRPAAYCGVVGYKPSQGLLPIEGALTFSHTLDQPGLFTRSVADAAWLAASLSDRPDGLRLPDRTRAPRLAAVRTPVWDLADETARRGFADSIRVLREAGADVTEVELPGCFGLAHGAIRTIMCVEAAFNLAALHRDHAALLSSTLGDFIAEGARTAAVAYLQALAVRTRLIDELERFLAGYDALITPPATGEAPETLEQTGNPAFCTIWSLVGAPAITIPVGLGPRGLPLGLQFAGAIGKDAETLAAARFGERLFPFPAWRAGA